MKISIYDVIKDHLFTLRDQDSRRISLVDITIFYVLPLALSFSVEMTDFRGSKEFYNLSMTFYGIFIALLLNLQVATFGIFQRKWPIPDDPRSAELQKSLLETRKALLREINANISYLTAISCVSVSIFLVFFALDAVGVVFVAISSYLYAHFVVTLLMVVKRSHALFRQEYDPELDP
jgi:hypothetical protein